MFRLKFVLLVILSSFCINIIAQKGGFNTDRLARYDNFLQNEVDAKRLPGCVSLVYRKGEVAHFKALGFDNTDTKVPMEKDQLFFIQSMTKPIISAAFMMLYEEGHFLLNDRVSKYIPAFDSLQVVSMPEGATEPLYTEPKSPVRIWNLLTHTAGFSHGLGQNAYEKGLNATLYEQDHKDISARVAALLKYPLMGHPGEQWNYSAAPDVLALLIEQFSGMTPEQFLQERIFTPLGMTNTAYNLTEAQASRLADLHAPFSGGIIVADYHISTSGNKVFGGTHGLFSTAEDYLKFCRMILNNGTVDEHQFLSRKTVELMQEDFVGDLFSPGAGFGLGFAMVTDISDYGEVGSLGALSWGGAFNTDFFYRP